ncbi:endonuclease/exonuclease/phosphatase family protein (plasmid) [Embleya sp. NBC_00888]|uniref:endonuclease/exonuclease/phosphatase family protein n=1 Tax=Embleya sp. NBC_00888 TaxID=2975960 RepID=UPI002F9186D6|nr:endonuclease/exonuclease/phosphatase family protein [Embleya sp. NBC_00888]
MANVGLPQGDSAAGDGDGPITVATFNFQNGGYDKRTGTYDLRPLAALAPLIADVDVLCFQEGWGYGADGQRTMFAAEEILGMRALRTPGPSGPLDVVVFVRWPRIGVERHYDRCDPAVFEDQYGNVHLWLPGFPEPVLVRSVQWSYASGDARLHAAQQLVARAAPTTWSLIAGDFNSLWPDRDGLREFRPRWSLLPAHARSHKTLPPGAGRAGRGRGVREWWAWNPRRAWRARREAHRWVTDTRATTVLADGGFVNAGSLARDTTVTVNAHVDNGQGPRIDHILFSPRLAAAYVPGSYRVVSGNLVDAAGDHRLVKAQLDARLLPRTSSTGTGTGRGISDFRRGRPCTATAGARARVEDRASVRCVKCSVEPAEPVDAVVVAA